MFIYPFKIWDFLSEDLASNIFKKLSKLLVFLFCIVFLLFFPILFTLGWMPQFDTFFVILLEQIDMHIFGGTGVYCVCV